MCNLLEKTGKALLGECDPIRLIEFLPGCCKYGLGIQHHCTLSSAKLVTVTNFALQIHEEDVVSISAGGTDCKFHPKRTSKGLPVNTTVFAVFSPATRISIVRLAGGSMRDPRAKRNVSRRPASCHAVWIPIHSPFL